VLTLPLFFASNAIYPLVILPAWLQAIALVNPLTYQTDALRTLMVAGGVSAFGIWLDLAVLVSVTILLVAIGGRLYPRVAQ